MIYDNYTYIPTDYNVIIPHVYRMFSDQTSNCLVYLFKHLSFLYVGTLLFLSSLFINRYTSLIFYIMLSYFALMLQKLFILCNSIWVILIQLTTFPFINATDHLPIPHLYKVNIFIMYQWGQTGFIFTYRGYLMSCSLFPSILPQMTEWSILWLNGVPFHIHIILLRVR